MDLERTSSLNWLWRVEREIDSADERSTCCDDFTARIYVLHKAGWLPTSITPSTSSGRPANGGLALADSVHGAGHDVGARSGADPAGVWLSEKRDMRAAFRDSFGIDVGTIDAVAIMVDCDNTAQHALACVDDIHFTEH